MKNGTIHSIYRAILLDTSSDHLDLQQKLQFFPETLVLHLEGPKSNEIEHQRY